jgi:hypothetical protein
MHKTVDRWRGVITVAGSGKYREQQDIAIPRQIF